MGGKGMGRRVHGYPSTAVWVVAAGLLAFSLTACFKADGDERSVAGAKPAAVKGLKDKPCIKVNASQDTGPYSLFDIPADMIEAEFIMAARDAKPKWQIFSEHAEPACEANVFVDVKGLSYSIDRMQSYDEVHTTLGVGAGMSVYIPGHSEQPIASVAVSDSVPAAAKLLASALEQNMRAARSPERPRSGAKQAEEGKFCYSLAAANAGRYEDLAQNFYYTSQNRIFTNLDGHKPSENCIPDFHVSVNDVEIRSSSGIEAQYGVLALRVPGETRSRIYLATGPGHSAALVRNINEMGKVLGSLERSAQQQQVVSRSWSDDEVRSVLETIVSSSLTYHSLTRGPDYDAETQRMLHHFKNDAERTEGWRRTKAGIKERQQRQDAEQEGSRAIVTLQTIMLKDADQVQRLAKKYERTLEKPQREMISDIIKAYSDIESSRDGNSPFITQANIAWHKKYE